MQNLGDIDAIRVLVVDNHELFAEGVRSILQDSGMEVAGVVTRGSEALEAARRVQPTVIVLNLALPDENGVTVGKGIVDGVPGAKVIAVTNSHDASSVKETIDAGLHGFLTREASASQLVNSVKAAAEGQFVIPHQVARKVTGIRTDEERRVAMLWETLSVREREVLALLVDGESTKQIARRLSLSMNTIRTHVHSVLTKLQVRSRIEAVAFVRRYGQIERRGETGRVYPE